MVLSEGLHLLLPMSPLPPDGAFPMRPGSFERCGCGDSAAEVVPHLKREWGKIAENNS